jgi:hypothetical protein
MYRSRYGAARRVVQGEAVVRGVLRLEARDYDGPTRWRWVLTDTSGVFIADHEVRLDARSWYYEAFTDLQHYISRHTAPDRYGHLPIAKTLILCRF